MWFHVDPRSPTPVYQQVVDGVKETVAKGILTAGDRLPSVRELAVQMTLNHNTVAKAYQELEREHVIEVLRGRGTFIAEPSPAPDRRQRIDKIALSLRQMLVEAHHLQLSDDDVRALFTQAIDEWTKDRGRSTT